MAFLHTAAHAKALAKKGKDENDPISTRYMKHALGESFHPIPTKEKDELRASSLPFCPILYIEAKKKNKLLVKDKPSVGWRDSFYLEIGTTAHALWQRVLTRAARDPKAPIKAKPYGGWQCTHCKRELKPQFLPEPCDCNDGGEYTEKEFVEMRLWQNKKAYIKQDIETETKAYKWEFKTLGPFTEWDYIEVHITYKGFSGHIDYIVYYPDYDRWTVFDLKTCMSTAITNPDKTLPILKNIFQIETYCTLLPKLIPLITHVSEYSLLYHTRESASKWYSSRVEWNDTRDKRAMKRVNRWCNGFAYANEYLEETRHDPDTLYDVINVRPCVDNKSWEREQLPAYIYEDGGQGKCPYLGECTDCEGDKLVRRIYAKMEERLHTHTSKDE